MRLGETVCVRSPLKVLHGTTDINKKPLFLKVCVKAQHEPAVTVMLMCYRCKMSETAQGEGGK